MVTARDSYDDWYADDGAYGETEGRWRSALSTRPLELVRAALLAFELVAPENFEDAQRIADRLRAGVPVFIDAGACEEALAGRLTDFASGLVYALGGGLQEVGRGVMLLTPGNVAVSGDEAAAVRPPGFYNRR